MLLVEILSRTIGAAIRPTATPILGSPLPTPGGLAEAEGDAPVADASEDEGIPTRPRAVLATPPPSGLLVAAPPRSPVTSSLLSGDALRMGGLAVAGLTIRLAADP